jgi:hypothetical protein
MNPKIPLYLRALFETSVQDALNAYGIYPGTSVTPSKNQKADFLFSAVLSRVETEWSISGKIQNDISFDPATGTYDSLALKRIVQDYVKNEILLETRNLQIDAERKILENLIDDDYFEKGGVKKLVEDLTAVVSPGSKNINKLLGTKVKSTSAESYRKTVLDVIHSDATKNLESTIKEVRIMQGTEKVPGASLKPGEKLTSSLVSVIDHKIEKGQLDSPHLVDVLGIKKDYEAATKPIKEQRDELIIQRNSLVGSAPSVAAERARISAEISRKENDINDIRTGTVGGVAGVGRNFEAEIATAQIVGNNNFSLNLGTAYTSTAAVGTSSPSLLGAAGITSGLPLFMTDARPVMMSVWEKDPEARVKIEELQVKLLAARTPVMRTFYGDQITSLTSKLTDSVSGRTADVFGYKFNSDGTLTIDDRIQNIRERSVKNLAKSFAYPNISKALNEYRLVDASTKVVYLEHLYLNIPKPTRISFEVEELIDIHNTYAQALKLASILPISGRLGAAELALINADKASFIANISKLISNPAEQAKVVGYLNSGDYSQFSIYFASGYGNKNAEIIRSRMNARLYDIATNDTISRTNPEFTRAVMDTALVEEAIKSQVLRRYTENVIMAAQLMTDGKYLRREIKRTFQKEVVTALGNKYIMPGLSARFGENSAFGDYLDKIYGTLSDPEFRKDPAKYIKENLVKGSKGFVGSYLNNKFKDRKKISLYGQTLDLDFTKIIDNPGKFITGTLKDRAFHLISNFAYTKLVPRFRLLRIAYLKLKRSIWKATGFLKKAATSLLQRVAPSLMSRFGAMIAGIAVPGVGWVITAVLAVLPVLLKPFLKDDITVSDLIKKAFKVIFLGPCLILVIIWIMVLVPIVSLFANFWSSLWASVTGSFDTWAKDVLARTAGSPFGVYPYDLGYELIDGLVNTSGNKCIDSNNKSLYANLRKNPTGWNNLNPADFSDLQNPTELSCQIICSARSELSTLYPGIAGLLNCSSTRNELFNKTLEYGDPEQRFYCSHTITKSWGATREFSYLDSDSFLSVALLNNTLLLKGSELDRTNLFNSDATWYTGVKGGGTVVDPSSACFDKNSLQTGAILTMSKEPDCSFSKRGNHVGMFLKYEGSNLVYINSNSGFLKESVPFEDCGGGKIKLKTKYYKEDNLRFYMCNLFQPKAGNSPTVTSCPPCAVPSINNYK